MGVYKGPDNSVFRKRTYGWNRAICKLTLGTEHEGSAPLTPKLAIGHDPESVESSPS
jgi:hypothetical protein